MAVAPHLHGLPVRILDQAVEAVLAHTQAVRLPAVVGAREAVWAAACVLADEARIAELADAMAGRAGARVHWACGVRRHRSSPGPPRRSADRHPT